MCWNVSDGCYCHSNLFFCIENDDCRPIDNSNNKANGPRFKENWKFSDNRKHKYVRFTQGIGVTYKRQVSVEYIVHCSSCQQASRWDGKNACRKNVFSHRSFLFFFFHWSTLIIILCSLLVFWPKDDDWMMKQADPNRTENSFIFIIGSGEWQQLLIYFSLIFLGLVRISYYFFHFVRIERAIE